MGDSAGNAANAGDAGETSGAGNAGETGGAGSIVETGEINDAESGADSCGSSQWSESDDEDALSEDNAPAQATGTSAAGTAGEQAEAKRLSTKQRRDPAASWAKFIESDELVPHLVAGLPKVFSIVMTGVDINKVYACTCPKDTDTPAPPVQRVPLVMLGRIMHISWLPCKTCNFSHMISEGFWPMSPSKPKAFVHLSVLSMFDAGSQSRRTRPHGEDFATMVEVAVDHQSRHVILSEPQPPQDLLAIVRISSVSSGGSVFFPVIADR